MPNELPGHTRTRLKLLHDFAALMAYVTDLIQLLQLAAICFCHRPVALFCFLHCEYSPGALAHVWHRHNQLWHPNRPCKPIAAQ